MQGNLEIDLQAESERWSGHTPSLMRGLKPSFFFFSETFVSDWNEQQEINVVCINRLRLGTRFMTFSSVEQIAEDKRVGGGEKTRTRMKQQPPPSLCPSLFRFNKSWVTRGGEPVGTRARTSRPKTPLCPARGAFHDSLSACFCSPEKCLIHFHSHACCVKLPAPNGGGGHLPGWDGASSSLDMWGLAGRKVHFLHLSKKRKRRCLSAERQRVCVSWLTQALQ